MNLNYLLLSALLAFSLWNCDSEDEAPAMTCSTLPTVTVINAQDTPCGIEEGSIEVSGNGGTGSLTYSIDGINFQTNPVFNNLPSGKYQITVRDENNCEGTTNVTLFSGISFSSTVEQLIAGTCAVGGCHVTGEQAPDLTLRDNIFTAAPRIETQLLANAMPPLDSGLPRLSESEMEAVICWVKDGALDN